MKTFAQLTVGDKFYRASSGYMKYDVITVEKVDGTEISFNCGTKIPRWKSLKEDNIEYSRYSSSSSTIKYFIKETDAIRYCKSQLMKSLFEKIRVAQTYIDEVKKFRFENYELLNHKWTEETIIEMERLLNQ